MELDVNLSDFLLKLVLELSVFLSRHRSPNYMENDPRIVHL